ncbi:MAG TPA: hypothetical protein VF710_07140 [Longimicrobium sp.]
MKDFPTERTPPGQAAARPRAANHPRTDAAMTPEPALKRAARFSLAWFAVALSLTTANQLRIGPVGPGELMLLAWMAVRVAAMTVQRAVFVPREGRPVLLFWAGAVVLLLAGWLSKLLVVGIPQRNAAFYDTFAFTFTAGAIVLYILQRDLGVRVRATAAYMLPVQLLPLAFLMLARFAGVTGAGPLKFWYGARFTGLSSNPNQAALAILPIPLAALYFLAQSRTAGRKAWWAGIAGLAALVGLATLSDGLVLAWAACAMMLATVLLYRIVSVRSGSILRQGLMRVVIPVTLLGCAGAIVPPALAIATGKAEELSGSSQGSDRIHIWSNGLRAAASSPLVGLGPGAHSGHDAPFEGFESHNTYIDWGASTGLLGVFMYLGLLCWAGFRAFRDRSAARLTILLALVVFSTFHYVLRQPSFWFFLLVVAIAAEPAGGGGGHRAHSPRRALSPRPAP